MPGVRDPALLKALAAEIRARRAHQEITQEELAHRSELQPLFIVRMEAAANQPSLSTFLKLAAGLGAEAPELLESILKRYKKERRLRAAA